MEIAIIGLSCRLPGADTPSVFWENIKAGVESVALFDKGSKELDAAYVGAAGKLRDIDMFDADLFGFTPRAAAALDPQHRLFLHCAWEAFEDAGIAPGEQPEIVGAFVGCGVNTYLLNNLWAGKWLSRRSTLVGSTEELQLLMGGTADFLPARVAYCLNLRGPVMNVQSACSTSLVAVHLACQSLTAGECEIALAGCSTVRVPHDVGHRYEEGAPFSRDGRTRCFDDQAGGTVFGSGVGAVLLKPLDAAVANGDPIHAVIRSSAVNNDGRRRAGFAAPGVEGQVAVLEEALALADIPARSIDLIEAHGTATAIGDQIEVEALRRAYGTIAAQPCFLGSVKANVGHLSWSAGMAGLIKAVFALKHGEVPPNIHTRSCLPELDGRLFTVNSRLTPLPIVGRPHRAAVSAFGLGGTNAHLILEEFPATARGDRDEAGTALLPLSASSLPDLRRLANRYADYFDRQPAENLDAVCRTASIGRRHFDKRLAVVGRTTAEMADALRRQANGEVIEAGQSGSSGPIAFLFTGQGPHASDVGGELYRAVPQFRQVLDQCDRHLQPIIGRSLTTILADPHMWEDLSLAYPAHFAFQCALASTWIAWGITPDHVMGHSAGEYAAACVAGMMRLEDGLAMAHRRGVHFEQISARGAMATVQAPLSQIKPFIDVYPDAISIAAVNGPLSTVISGDEGAVARLCVELSERGYRTEPLSVSRAGHSPLVEPILAGLHDAFQDIDFVAPSISLISNVTGELATTEMATADYWVRQSRETVEFAAGIATLEDLKVDTFIEIGPATTLIALAAFCRGDRPSLCLPSIRPSARERRSDREMLTMLTTLSELYVRGASVNWRALPGFRSGQRLHLPTTPLTGQRYWVDEPTASSPIGAAVPLNDSPTESYGNDRLTGAVVEIGWQELAIRPNPAAGQLDGLWVLVGGSSQDVRAFSGRIAAAGGACRHFASSELGNLDQILREVAESCRGVVLLPNVVDFDEGMSVDALCEQAWRCCEPQAAAARALSNLGLPLRLWILTRSAQSMSPPVRVNRIPEAVSWAVGRVLAMEHPALPVTAIDMGDEDAQTAADYFLAEVRSGGPPAFVAWQAGRRFVARLRRRDDLPRTSGRYHDDAVYALVGGLGDMGLAVARQLVAGGARRLLLVGRSPPSDSARDALDELARSGTTVHVEVADVTDREALRAAFQRAAIRHPIRGIFHLAGKLDDQLLDELDQDRFISVLRPKVGGAWNLHLLAKELALPLDQFVMFSSATAMVGNGGQASHAAANAILDHLAHHRAALGLPGQSIAWGVWSEIGKLSGTASLRKKLETAGFGMIGTAAGLAALQDVIGSGLPHIGVIPADWDRFVRHHLLTDVDYYRDLHALGGLSAGDGPRSRTEGWIDLDAVGLREGLTNLVVDLVSELTGDRFDPSFQNDLRAAGLDSLGLVQLCGHLRNHLGVSVPLAAVMGDPTLPRITENLLEFLERLPTAPTVAVVGEAGSPDHLSTHQERWLSLIKAKYGLRVVPILFSGRLDRASFRRALVRLVDRHAVLRLIFDPKGTRSCRAEDCVPPDDRLFLAGGGVDTEARRRQLAAWVEAAYATPPDPERECSWSIACVDNPGDTFLVLLVVQHLEFDGAGLTTFAQELDLLYAAERNGSQPRLDAITPYRDFVRDQEQYLQREIASDRAFFQGLYTNLASPTRLPKHPGFDKTCPLPAQRWTVRTSASVAEELRGKARILGVTPFSILLTAYGRLVSSITGEAEVAVSMITSCRIDPRFEKTIGPFTAPYPVPLLTSGMPLEALAKRCQRAVSGILSRARYPVTDLTEHVAPFIGLPRDTYFSDVGINFTNYRKVDQKSGSTPHIVEILGAVDDPVFSSLAPRILRRVPGLHLVIDWNASGLGFNFWYHVERFPENMVQAWSEQYCELLSEMVA